MELDPLKIQHTKRLLFVTPAKSFEDLWPDKN
jgi:hypothetical protein